MAALARKPLKALEEAIAQLQKHEGDSRREARGYLVSLVLVIVCIVMNGILIQYFSWATDSIFRLDKKAALIAKDIASLQKELSQLEAQFQAHLKSLRKDLLR